jgi:hypothetical protein
MPEEDPQLPGIVLFQGPGTGSDGGNGQYRPEQNQEINALSIREEVQTGFHHSIPRSCVKYYIDITKYKGRKYILFSSGHPDRTNPPQPPVFSEYTGYSIVTFLAMKIQIPMGSIEY